MRYEYVHEECNKPAFYFEYETMPGPMTVIKSKDVTLLDGSKPKLGNLKLCGTCGKSVKRFQLKQLKKISE